MSLEERAEVPAGAGVGVALSGGEVMFSSAPVTNAGGCAWRPSGGPSSEAHVQAGTCLFAFLESRLLAQGELQGLGPDTQEGLHLKG